MDLSYPALIISACAAFFAGLSLYISIRLNRKQEQASVAQKRTEILFKIHKIRFELQEFYNALPMDFCDFFNMGEEKLNLDDERTLVLKDLREFKNFYNDKPLNMNNIILAINKKFIADLIVELDNANDQVEILAKISNVAEMESLKPDILIIEHLAPYLKKKYLKKFTV